MFTREERVCEPVIRRFQERRPLGRLFQGAGDLAVVQFELDHGGADARPLRRRVSGVILTVKRVKSPPGQDPALL
jgi:hypothetical protein